MTTEPDTTATADQIEELLRGDDVQAAEELLDAMHPADQADLYDRLDDAERETMLALLSTEDRALTPRAPGRGDARGDRRERMPRVELARVLDVTSNDIAADVAPSSSAR